MSRRSGRAGWRPALRVAWRDARRAKARTALVLAMVALPVAAVTAADVARSTQEITGVEAVERRVGAADALVAAVAPAPVLQLPDPDRFYGAESDVLPAAAGATAAPEGDRSPDAPPTAAEVERVLGPGTRLLEVRRGQGIAFETDRGVADGELTEVDLRDPLATGLFELTDGRWPEQVGEVVVNATLADRGPGLHEALVLRDGTELEVVGLAESTTTTGWPMAAGPLGTLGPPQADSAERAFFGGTPTAWLADAPGPVTWAEVRDLNALGATALSRAVLADPPPVPPEVEAFLGGTGLDSAVVTVVVLVVVMALLELVLLAGPAFAVSARRHARTLALLAAAGGTPRQARRIVLASGVVLGGLAAVLGTVVGVVAGWAVLPLLQRFSDTRFGPFDVPWTHLPVVAGFGVLSAFLAAVVPAVLASRQDVVAVLAGRRGDRRPSRRSPVLGVALVAVGVALAAYGAAGGGETLIAVSAIVTVVGMVLLVPLVVAGVARLARRAPLTLRYAVRDAARHRTRTAPAVAAVAATVAGVVALGIGLSSDEAQNELAYDPQLPMGWGIATGAEVDPEAWTRAARAALPRAQVEVVQGVVEDDPEAATYTSLDVRPSGSGPEGSGELFPNGWNGSLGTGWLVADEVPDALATVVGLSAAERAAAAERLAAGGVVLLSDAPLPGGEVLVRVQRSDWDTGEPLGPARREVVPATTVPPGPATYPPAAGVLSPATASALGLDRAPRAVVVSGAEIGERAAADVEEAVEASGPNSDFYVERGYVTDGETQVVQLLLLGLGAVLMLGGTLTATFLALADARPDLATLAAVGASPRRRRGVAAAYALVVGGVGAVLGAAVGFVPGVAVSFPLTRGYDGDGVAAGHVLDVPWLLIGTLVVALPLVVAGVVWLTARSRLPLTARLD